MALRVPKRRAYRVVSVLALAAGIYTVYNGVRDSEAIQQNIGTIVGGAVLIIAGCALAFLSFRAGPEEMLTLR